MKLFEGERWLVITGLLGFTLANGIAMYICLQGAIILPEGDLRDAFSFNVAIGIFLLSVAAILPFARFGVRKRKVFRGLLIIASLYSYTIETVQNFRGFNPRFSREGSFVEIIGGMLFGVVSLIIVVLMLLLTIQFFRIKTPFERPLLLIGIRYALFSVLIANLAGIWMILLQDRFSGDTGNIIVLHGIGFHALQTLIFLGWLLEKAQLAERVKKLLLHFGCISWTISIVIIGLQTGLGRTVFELTTLPIISCILLLVWFGIVIVPFVLFIKSNGLRINCSYTGRG